MILLKQPNPWTCLATAFAMALGVEVEDVFNLAHHDGSGHLWKELPADHIHSRAGHHIQEMVDVSYKLGYAVIEIHPYPGWSHFNNDVKETPELWTLPDSMYRFDAYMKNSVGVLDGTVGPFKSGHAVAWDGNFIFDPRGQKVLKNEFEFNLEKFYLLKRIYS